jgi:acetyl-CoA C-acetyltransferase
MPETVHCIGVGRTDFKRNLKKEGKALRDVIVEAGRAAIEDAGVEPSAVQSGVVGNFAAGRLTKQLHLGAYLCEIDESMLGLPTFHTEAACASGSVALVAAFHQIMGGIYDVVLVVGAEQQKTMPPNEVGDVLASAGDYAIERPKYGELTFPALFGHIATVYNEKYGLTEKDLAAVAAKNRMHATLNPLAQMRDAGVSDEQACAVSDKNPTIAGMLKLCDCSQITDGAAATLLVSGKFLSKLGKTKKPAIKLLGFGNSTDYLPVERKDAPTFTVARKAAQLAFSKAGCSPRDIQGLDVHDCFSISEICAYEILGLAENGQGAKLALSGATRLKQVGGNPRDGVPIVNPGGGLIGDGHPVGATGVRQVVEAVTHLRGEADKRQIDGCKRYMTFNMGGSFTTAVAAVWGV